MTLNNTNFIKQDASAEIDETAASMTTDEADTDFDRIGE